MSVNGPLNSFTSVIDLQTQTDALAEPTLPEVPRGVSSLEQWAHPFGGEEQEMEAMVAELLSAFPSQTSESELEGGARGVLCQRVS